MSSQVFSVSLPFCLTVAILKLYSGALRLPQGLGDGFDSSSSREFSTPATPLIINHCRNLQTIYVDQIQIIGGGGQPSPVPSPVAAPVAAPVASPVAAPVAAPVPGGTEIVGGAVYVERVEDKGVDILPAQEDGTALVVSTKVC